MISQETIEEIKERANLTEVVSESVSLKRLGRNWVGLCPFHAEKTGSFHVRDDRFYHCFGCGESGNIISYVMKIRGLSFSEAIEELAQRFGIAIKRQGGRLKEAPRGDPQKLYRANRAAFEVFSAALKKAPLPVKSYLEGRALSADAIQAFGLGFAPPGWNDVRSVLLKGGFSEEILLQAGLVRRSQKGELYDTFRARLMFPIFSDARHIVGFGGRIIPGLADEETLKTAPKYLNSSESGIYEKSKVLFGLPQALAAVRESSEVYLVEGYMDVIGLWQAGVKNVVATCGTALSEKHARRLRFLAKKVCVLFDGDQAGRTAAGRSFAIFLNSGLDVSAIFLNEDKDPDDFAKRHGRQTAQALAQLGRVSLLDCYLETLLAKYGVREARSLGAASKGRLGEELCETLKKVKNSIERSELIQAAALRLLVPSDTLAQMVAPAAAGTKVRGAEEQAPDTWPRPQRMGFIPEIKELPALDREVLLAIMVKKEEIIPSVLKDPELCSALHPVSLGFIEGMAEITCRGNIGLENKKESIRILLKNYGDSWVKHWKKAYEVTKDPEVDFTEVVEECRRSAKKSKLNQAIEDVRGALRAPLSEDDKLSLMQQKLELERQLRTLF